MVYVVQAYLAFRNAARRNAIASNIQTRLAQTVPYGVVARVDSDPNGDTTPSPATSLEVAFLTRAEADQFWADALAFVGSGVNGPVTGSSLSRHDCSRDGDPVPCVVADSRAW